MVVSTNPGQGECQECLSLLNEYYKEKRFGCTVALNPTMRHIAGVAAAGTGRAAVRRTFDTTGGREWQAY